MQTVVSKVSSVRENGIDGYWLFVNFDYKIREGVSSTNEEHMVSRSGNVDSIAEDDTMVVDMLRGTVRIGNRKGCLL